MNAGRGGGVVVIRRTGFWRTKFGQCLRPLDDKDDAL